VRTHTHRHTHRYRHRHIRIQTYAIPTKLHSKQAREKAFEASKHCDTLQYTATRCNILQHATTHYREEAVIHRKGYTKRYIARHTRERNKERDNSQREIYRERETEMARDA